MKIQCDVKPSTDNAPQRKKSPPQWEAFEERFYMDAIVYDDLLMLKVEDMPSLID